MESAPKGLIAWFARNPVAANLLMIFILVGGAITARTIIHQSFPEVKINWLKYSAFYPGAAPQEVEEGITIKIEEALESIQGLDRVLTYSNRNASSGYFSVADGYDPQIILEEVKSQIGSVSSFPNEMEAPIIERIKFKQSVMNISLYGDVSPKVLKELGRGIHDEIQQLSHVSISEFYSGLQYEISIEVSKEKLREYNLSFEQVALAIRGSSRNMSAGQIRAENGYINLRVEQQAYKGYQFQQIPILTLNDGTKVLLGDIADINDGFEEGLQYSKFNGQNSAAFFIFAADNQNINDVANQVKEYVAEKSKILPDNIHLETWLDSTEYLSQRLTMMLDNMMSGAVLVFLILALFLRTRLAFWVMMGLPVCFLGTLMIMPIGFINVTINLVSLFAFILVLGIVVDDAIVMGESAHDEIEQHGHSIDNVVRGVHRVAVPATFGVLTTIAAFVPLVLDDGPASAFGKAIGFVVIFCLIFSLIESKLILPSHLAQMKPKVSNPKNPLDRLRKVVDRLLKSFIYQYYKPALNVCITYRYAVLMTFICVLFASVGLYKGGVIKFIGQPKIPSDYPSIKVDMNVDSAEQQTLETVLKIKKVIENIDEKIAREYGQKMIADIEVRLNGRVTGDIAIKLVEPELRPMNAFELADKWRKALPRYPGLKSLTISDNLIASQREDGDIAFRLSSKSEQHLQLAAQALSKKLNTFKGVGDVNDSRQTSAKEVQFELKPLAYSLGFTLANIASQVGYSFYGLEAQRILRDTEEIKVMLRYPLEQRSSVGHVGEVMIKAPNGAELPLSQLANITLTNGVTSIRRENGKRTINVWASVDADQVEPFKVANNIIDNFVPEITRIYPNVTVEVTGKVNDEMESTKSQSLNFIFSLMIIFTLLAVPLRSYAQPIIIMMVIPFGIVGAAMGHLILGMNLSILSIFGIIAASGVVINDSLVMVDYVNKTRQKGTALTEAVIYSGCKRFRAIILTSLTTFVGLAPIVFFETSTQAQIIIPMAVSLSFGVLFATLVTLLLIPILYIVIEDIKVFFQRIKKALFFKSRQTTAEK